MRIRPSARPVRRALLSGPPRVEADQQADARSWPGRRRFRGLFVSVSSRLNVEELACRAAAGATARQRVPATGDRRGRRRERGRHRKLERRRSFADARVAPVRAEPSGSICRTAGGWSSTSCGNSLRAVLEIDSDVHHRSGREGDAPPADKSWLWRRMGFSGRAPHTCVHESDNLARSCDGMRTPGCTARARGNRAAPWRRDHALRGREVRPGVHDHRRDWGRTPRAPARACLSLLPSGPGEVRRVSAARGVGCPVYGGARRGAVSFSAEDSPSGLGRTIGNRVGLTPSGVQIPYPPPAAGRCGATSPHRPYRFRARST